MTKAEKAFRHGYRLGAAKRLSETGAPPIAWGWLEWVVTIATTGFGIWLISGAM